MINNVSNIIQEEVNNFDFLGTNSNQKLLDNRELLSNIEILYVFSVKY